MRQMDQSDRGTGKAEAQRGEHGAPVEAIREPADRHLKPQPAEHSDKHEERNRRSRDALALHLIAAKGAPHENAIEAERGTLGIDCDPTARRPAFVEPRDDHGRWTGEGGESESERETAPPAVAIGATAAVAAEAGASVFGQLGRAALTSLADFAAGMAGPTAFFGVLFLPANRGLVAEGPLPGRPDLGYRYDRDTGVLDIYRQSEAGRPLLVSAHIGTDGRFYDADGRVIGRSLGSTVLVDPEALPAPLGLSGAEARVASASERDQPKLCPNRSKENIAGRSKRSLAYQEQISQLPRGFEVKLNGVRFDGCREEDGTMLEAKGPGYADKMVGPETWQEWYTGVRSIKAQMKSQAKASVDRNVEWHFAEPAVARYFRGYAEQEGLANIDVRYTPVRRSWFPRRISYMCTGEIARKARNPVRGALPACWRASPTPIQRSHAGTSRRNLALLPTNRRGRYRPISTS